MAAILALLPMFQSAIGVIGAFKGNAAAAKVDSAVQDAVSVVKAVTPLIEQFGRGEEVTPEDARQALAGMHAQLDQFDELIAQKSASAPGT